MKIKSLEELQKIKERGLKSLYPEKKKITVGMASCGIAAGAKDVYDEISKQVEGMDILVSLTGCIGWCQKEPLVNIFFPDKTGIAYGEMSPKKVKKIIDSLDERKIFKDGILYGWGNGDFPPINELDFYKKQQRIVLKNCGFVNPESIEEYIGCDGYFSLYNVLTRWEPEKVIEEVTKSGLRGRGGAGFPTGVKWSFTRRSQGEIKYIICNADEGDPGAYMDRSVLEGDPHSVLEGMIIGAYAIGAHEGYIYVRAEYPLAVERIQKAIDQAEEYGLFGENIFNSGFDFNIKINRGAGAFVCGEETALIASIEGRMGEPRPRPPFPAEKGLWDRPTNINNVETWANVPNIIGRSADWYSKIGAKNNRGTKVFSLVGNIKNTGLIEVPLGIKLKEIIFDIGGGVPAHKKLKAVQTGGPSGGCIPSKLIDLPVDYEHLTEAGSIMGSGGMVVMDEEICMVSVAKYFLNFTCDESCGKCTPCRDGIYQMVKILDNITEGKGKEEDLILLEELANMVKETSLCGLGQTAPNPVLTTLKYFRDEYEAHIKDKKCPAGICRALIQYFIVAEKCEGCGKCVELCPQGAIEGKKKKPHTIDLGKCIKCGICYESCPFEAIVRK